ncbi:hypothetical protein [Lewinella sp. W8]|uniref:hypothetical protein n=1 Tax=Lewinella sp. W8 TaxID=2528208 RepID=UPI001067781F|nr:hypothetical protein [Lewinella sp. W8]MTB53741.1 hypothetical protein [Lewinella sp. W8]
MAQPDNPKRDEWLRGEFPGDAARDPFGESAARGRRELDSPEEAADLLAGIEARLEAVYGKPAVRKKDAPARVRSLGRWYAAAAAILLLVVAGIWWINQPATFDAETVFAETFTPYANDLSGRTMGGDEADSLTNEALQAALLAYDRRDYPAAAAAFGVYRTALPDNSAPASAPNPSAISLYYGISLLGTDEAETAAEVLEPLTDDATYGLPAKWYLALAYLRAERTDDSKNILQPLSRRNDTPFARKAADLLKTLP